MQNKSLEKIYNNHHGIRNRRGFTLLEEIRGEMFSRLIGKNKSILDLGCRDGTLTRHFYKDNKVLGVDIDGELLSAAKESLGIEVLKMDLNSEWEEIGKMSFDVVVAGEVMEHLYYPSKVVERVIKRLNLGGMFIGSVPNAFHLKNRVRYLVGQKNNTPLADPTHINQFSASELYDVLSQQFKEVNIMGLGKYKTLAKLYPSWFAYDLVFICQT